MNRHNSTYAIQEAIDRMVREALYEVANEVDNERLDEKWQKAKYAKPKEGNTKKTTAAQLKKVLKMLRDDTVNQAGIMRKLWHPKSKGEEDAKRSLFSKKVTGKPDSDGNVHSFTPEETRRLFTILTAN